MYNTANRTLSISLRFVYLGKLCIDRENLVFLRPPRAPNDRQCAQQGASRLVTNGHVGSGERDPKVTMPSPVLFHDPFHQFLLPYPSRSLVRLRSVAKLRVPGEEG